MSTTASAPTVRHFLFVCLTLGGIYATAPWPVAQTVLNTFLVVGLAPEFRSPLIGACWAAAAGWVLEGTLRVYPHLGGTALGNLLAMLLAAWVLAQWPPNQRRSFWTRLAVLAVVHALLVHVAVRIAGGPHPWGWGPLWTLLTAPLWGSVAFMLHRPLHRR